ncbi:GNAT family N-acetyltransferase [Oscillatoria salina]|uniref:GNAT family N-acetyltransferase n=1 Tax=Oscillatoria salina TaxID=331517 RepID=UPI0013BA97C0|nr:GNAT family N-acetyltransferase [Oscillatoria salina]MBZ8180905.1 GNAT family N-acetyltransferase [Oscillatoria salina IIICB1]NET91326.1 GNAT family N-acetyltransferase [Kamptonema sp. SIO1D9]
MNELPPGCQLRPATARDIWKIRLLVLQAMLDPTQIRWQQFWVIESEGEIIACGQLRAIANIQELGSIIVKSRWRGQGIATYLIKYLISQATQPLYLECLGARLASFYTRFGFEAISFSELPASLKSKYRLSHLAKTILRVPVTFMKYRQSS